MNAQDVERLLREDAARLERELADIDLDAGKKRILDRLGLNPDPAGPTGEQSQPR